jgi:molybdopterin-guanine dinucleotide biosynthesis protein A
VYARACRNAVARRLDRRDLTMTGLLEGMRVRVIDSSDLEPFGNSDRLLANVNTPVEFNELEALLGHKL